MLRLRGTLSFICREPWTWICKEVAGCDRRSVATGIHFTFSIWPRLYCKLSLTSTGWPQKFLELSSLNACESQVVKLPHFYMGIWCYHYYSNNCQLVTHITTTIDEVKFLQEQWWQSIYKWKQFTKDLGTNRKFVNGRTSWLRKCTHTVQCTTHTHQQTYST